jgi:hypothetical protein
MSFEEMYPALRAQALYATMRYDPKKKDKMQELISMAYIKYKKDIESCKEPNLNIYKSFISKRAREIDFRSVCLKGMGGNSTSDALSPYRRRPDQDVEIISFDEWMTSKPRGKQRVEETLDFNIDFKNWQNTLTKREKRIFNFLALGYSATKIAEKIKLSYVIVKECIKRMREGFIRYFQLANNKPLTALG